MNTQKPECSHTSVSSQKIIGLIQKDFFSLHHILRQLLSLTAGVIIIAVLFVLSARYGNIARINQYGMEEAEFFSIFRVPVFLILLFPLCYATSVTECFLADEQADFSKVLCSMPLRPLEIVISRYLSCLFLALISLVGSLIAAFIASIATSFFPMLQLFAYAVATFSGFIIYDSVFLLLNYRYGKKTAETVVFILSWVIIYAIMALLYIGPFVGLSVEVSPSLISDFITGNCLLFLVAALSFGAISFGLSYTIVKQKGEYI